MATSGSTDFVSTRDTIIKDALSLLGVLGESQTPSTDTVNRANRFLNRMVKSFQADGLNLWTTTEGTIFLQEDKATYNINASTGDIAAKGTTYRTTVDGTTSSGSTSITVADSTGMAISNYIVIQQDDGTILSTTITNIVGDTLTLNTALTDDATDGNLVTVFATKLDRPLEILYARYKNSSGVERTLISYNRDDYMMLPNKTSTGVPVGFYYDPQMSTGKVSVWPVPSDSSGVINITYTRVIEDFDSSSDTPDLPVEWEEALVYGLAMRMGAIYGKQEEVATIIGPQAQAYYQTLLNWDNEKNSMMIIQDYRPE